MTEKITINRQSIYLYIDSVKIEDEKGLKEIPNQFVAFYKDSPVNEIAYGEILKDAKGNNMVFTTSKEAKETSIQILEKIIYPPTFLHPLNYTKENLPEIMHKTLTYDLGAPNNDEIQEIIEGVMTSCTLASNPPYLPASATITLENGKLRTVDFFEVKRIRS